MGREVKDISIDKEPNSVLVNSKSVSHGSQHKLMKSGEPVEKKSGLEDYEVKECTREYSTENGHEEQDEQSAQEKILDNGAHSTGNIKNLNSDKRPASRPIAVGNGRSHHTVPQPFTLATEKRASCARPAVAETAAGGGTNKANDPPLSNSTAKSQAMVNSPVPSRKKHPDEEETCSDASSVAASVRSTKSKTTVPSAPRFRCVDRAEKRKEFYSKLEEKNQALEAERAEYEARIKEEQDAALKQLRKTLSFKANPMPSFYHEGPPPKPELKKVPTTRAKSPKFSRRKSCSDAINSSHGDKVEVASARVNRHSLGTYKKDNTVANKDTSGNMTCKVKGGSKQAKETSQSVSPKVNEERNAKIPVQ